MTTSTSSPKPLWRHLLPPAFWLGAWQFFAWIVDLSMNGKGNELLLPYPGSVALALLELGQQSGFWVTILSSLGRILAGMMLGSLLGVVLAGLTCLSPLAHDLLSPAIKVIRATPVASFILLVLLWVRRGWVPVVISALMVLPVVWSNLSRGIRETDAQLLEMARAYRFSRWKTLTLVYLPCVRPYFLSAVTTSMGLAWKSGAAAEVLCLPSFSIGTQIYNTKYYLEVPQLFAWTVVIVTLSLGMERLLMLLLARKNRRWQS